MEKKYDFNKIESKWKKIWEKKDDLYSAQDDSTKPKHYHLIEFPYPSGAGLHVGHCMGYGASDAYCRMKSMQGFNVLFPMGWDAFGLPTENYAIKTGRKPAEVTKENTDIFRNQMKNLSYSFDWGREINTSDPAYYRWTQWIFLQFYKHAIVDEKLVEVSNDDTSTPRLAYQSEMPINWCPSCKTGLANEEVVSGKCERCGTEVIKKMQKQWMLRITSYADRLIQDLDSVNYLEKIKTQQVNWIGKSVGTNIKFKIKNSDSLIEVFTTRADTLYGCTYVVVAPEHSLVESLQSSIKNLTEVKDYIENTKKKSDMERTELAKEKTGVKLDGVIAINPINGKEIDVYVADYVLVNYGTGAVMAVPAHDERDWEFAKKYNIPILQVIAPEITYHKTPPREGLEWIERNAAESIIYNPKTDKYLCLEWKKLPWTCFVTGGIEEGEDPIKAAKREIHEETGYKNVNLVKCLGRTRLRFHAAHKNCNRLGNFVGFLFELENEERNEPSNEEKEIHEVIWLSREEITEERMICASYEFWMKSLDNKETAFTDYGTLVNSNEYNGLTSEEAKKKITEKLKSENAGDFSINYKLRDWIFSRQHYWGEPIPIIHCPKCGTIPMEEKDLPLKLPEVEDYKPTNTGESPLATISEWVNIKCPKCGGEAKRETDTMPNWAGSSWYFLRYCDPKNNEEFASMDKLKYWMPVDLYNGGMEHTTLHLLYSRFWNKFLFDLGVVPTSEPYQKRIAHGIILGTDGRKMSKSFGNVINPNDIVEQYGADTTRAYIMFIGPYDSESAWSMAGVAGVSRFLNRVYNNFVKVKKDFSDSKELLLKLNQSVVGVTDDLENFRLNTVVSKLMELNNIIEKQEGVSTESYEKFIKLLFPVVPHFASELWELIGNTDVLNLSPWPIADKKYLVAEEIEVVVQINGKVRDKLIVSSGISEEELKHNALESDRVKANLSGKEVIKVIVVPKKLVSIVAK